MKNRVKIQLRTARCRRAGRTSSADEFFVAGVAVSQDGQLNAVVTTPLPIDDGQTREFDPPYNVIFDAVLDDDKSIVIVLVARDDNVTKDWRKRPEWVETLEDTVANADARGASAIVARIVADQPVGWAVLIGAISVGLALGIYFLIPAPDADTTLGHLAVIVKAGGSASEVREWLCEEDVASYTVRYEVTRTPIDRETTVHSFAIEVKRRKMTVTTDPASVVPGRSARLTVSAVDADTGAAVTGTVRLLDLNDAFPTNVPFDATFPAGPLNGVRGAVARVGDWKLRDLFDDGFDWPALEHRTPKGLVTAADYDASAVMVDVVLSGQRSPR